MPRYLHELPLRLEYEGNKYSQLSSEQQSSIHVELMKRCHSHDVLRLEGLILENEPLPSGIAHKSHLDMRDFAATPKVPSIERRKAVVIDCEWGQVETRLSEVVTICAVDFLTGETLIDSLVAPSRPMFKWRSHVHGITAEDVEMAVREHRCLKGWREARAMLFQFIDESTILVGHSVRFIFQMLRMFHRKIVDSQILVKAAVSKVPPKKGNWSKTKVCEGFLGINIGQNGTSSVFENVLASREVVLHCIQRPHRLKEWAAKTRAEFWKSKNDKKDEQQPMNDGNSAISSTKQATSDLMTDENEAAIAFSHAYEARYQAAYQAGFQSGFQMGYERGYENANAQGKRTWTNNIHINESWGDEQHKNPDLIQYSDEEDSYGDQNGNASQNGSDGEDGIPAVETGGLLAQLMKDDKIKEMIQRANQNEEKKEESRSARIRAKLEDLGTWRSVPEHQPPKQECEGAWDNIMDW